MTVELKAQFVKSAPCAGVYRVAVDIIDAVNIDFDVLVFKSADESYSHVATVYDLETWALDPVTVPGCDTFFRGRGAVVNFDSVAKADDFISVTKGRLKLLANQWNEVAGAFEGTEICDITSDTTS